MNLHRIIGFIICVINGALRHPYRGNCYIRVADVEALRKALEDKMKGNNTHTITGDITCKLINVCSVSIPRMMNSTRQRVY